MPGFLLHVSAGMQCFHQTGVATVTPSQSQVLVNGQQVATVNPTAIVASVAGCLFQIPTPGGPKPQPCVTVKWTMPSTRVKVFGLPVALVPSLGTGPGICQSVEPIQQGAPTVSAVQTRVIGT